MSSVHVYESSGDVSFSVVIPLYNKRNQIKETITGVLAQTHREFELIVVDDGSIDGSGEIVKAMTDSRVRLVRQENSGAAAARKQDGN